VKHLIVFTQISYTAIWVVQKAIDIYTEKPDGSVKPVSLGYGRTNKENRTKSAKPHQKGLTRYMGKKSGYDRSIQRV
jgi:hypothetical protein